MRAHAGGRQGSAVFHQLSVDQCSSGVFAFCLYHHSAVAIDKVRTESSWGLDEFDGFELIEDLLPKNTQLKFSNAKAHATMNAKPEGQMSIPVGSIKSNGSGVLKH